MKDGKLIALACKLKVNKLMVFLQSQKESLLQSDNLYAPTLAVFSRFLIFFMAELFNSAFKIGRSPERLLCSWDCGWYATIMNQGYDLVPHHHPDGNAANWAFFPFFPLMTKVFSVVTTLSLQNSAIILNNISFIAAISILYKYVKLLADKGTARFVVALMAFSPYSLYFSVPYTESLYFLLMISSLYCARANGWIAAGSLAAALSATRNLGVFTFFSLLVLALRRYGFKSLIKFAHGVEKVWVSLSLVPLGLFAYMFYLYLHVGDALAFKHIQLAWKRSIGNPFDNIGSAFLSGDPFWIYSGIVGCFTLFCGVYLAVKGYMAEGLIVLIGVLIPLSTGLASVPRYALALFPVYLAIGLLTKNCNRLREYLLYFSISLIGFFAMSWISVKPYMI